MHSAPEHSEDREYFHLFFWVDRWGGADAPLYTCDHKLASDGHRAEISVFPRTH